MKKVFFAAFMLLAVAGTAIAQAPAKKDTTKHENKHAKMHHKSHPMKKQTPAKKP